MDLFYTRRRDASRVGRQRRLSLLQDGLVYSSGRESGMKELQTVGHTEAQSCHLLCSPETELAELSACGLGGQRVTWAQNHSSSEGNQGGPTMYPLGLPCERAACF